MTLRLLATLILLLCAGAAAAHSMNTAQWHLSQRDAQTWSSHLRLPEDIEGELLTLHPRWPAQCTRIGAPGTQPTSNGSVLSWTLHCPSGLSGELALDGFSARLPDAVLQFEPLGAAPRHVVLSTTRPYWTISEEPERLNRRVSEPMNMRTPSARCVASSRRTNSSVFSRSSNSWRMRWRTALAACPPSPVAAFRKNLMG